MSGQITGIDWQDAFDIGSYVENVEQYRESWPTRSAEFRQSCKNCELDISYGDAEREKMDIFYPETEAKGLMVFIHGGYWKAYSKSDWSYLAEGALKRGYVVAMPSYTLAPEANPAQMARQVQQAIAKAANLVEGPIFMAGHSAGGHLVSRTICEDTNLSSDILERIKRVVSISGLHDLRPILLNDMNDILGLDQETATTESAVLHKPVSNAKMICWVGEKERPEFIRQSALLAEAWGKAPHKAELVVDTTHNHFSVVDGLTNANSPILNAILRTE